MKPSSEVDKKIAEMKSYFGIGEPVYSKNRAVEVFCIFLSKWYYRLTKGLYFKTKYFLQKLFRGYDDLDKWNVAWYIARKSIPILLAWRNGKIMGTAIRKHIENRHGEVIELSDKELKGEPEALSQEQWLSVIDDIIFAFQFVIDEDNIDLNYTEDNYKQRYKRHKKGLKLFSIYFTSLWD